MKKNIYKLKLFFLTCLLTTLIGLAPLAAEQAILAVDFRPVAREATPAVVSIKVLSLGVQTGAQQPPQDFRRFQSPFFNQFFGMQQPQALPQQPPQQPVIGQGSGFLVSHDGYILTNNHVIKEAQEIAVTIHDGREFDARIVGQDPNTDVAVIKIEAQGLPFLRLGDSTEVEQGQWVIAIGNPLGLQATLTVGVLSAKGRNNLNITRFEDYLQVDAAINHGNSGGPLLDTDGQVIGINTAIANNAMGIGFAIPSNMAQHVMDQLIEKGAVERGYLGLLMQPLSNDLAASLGMDKAEGALVTEVLENSPAHQAGIRPGDVIVRYDGQSVENPARLSKAVSMSNPGHRARLMVVREGRYLEIQVDLQLTPEVVAGADQLQMKLGLEIKTLTPEISQRIGQPGLQGALVTKVHPGSPGALAQLQPGQVIVSVNHEKVLTEEDFYRHMRSLPKGSKALVWVKHGSHMRFVAIKVS